LKSKKVKEMEGRRKREERYAGGERGRIKRR
jgi:hypothetical protein